MYYLYRITNQISNKVYIGQSKEETGRWKQHRYFSKHPEKTGQYIHRAMAKYGIENFTFEIIATCRTQDDANEMEDILINQYNSRNKDYGYNLNAGGFNGLHSEETKQKIREATLKQIETKGHPAQGFRWSDEQKANASLIQKTVDRTPTEEERQKRSKSHMGHKDSRETKRIKSESAKLAWVKRKASI